MEKEISNHSNHDLVTDGTMFQKETLQNRKVKSHNVFVFLFFL